ncbi:uncharacterized protein [Ptychodera flava]|uniref:uncharacterized protein isoform X2 n=1 Tax=Ptychodera flava TaxID=63121 RepID=UPI00396A96E3
MLRTVCALELLFLILNTGVKIMCEGSGKSIRHCCENKPLSCSFEVRIREDTPVGDVIFAFPRHKLSIRTNNTINETSAVPSDYSNTHSAFPSTFIQITDGNKNERFTVDSETGDISVQGYLDCDIDPEYILAIVIMNSKDESNIQCSLKVILEDVEGWPLYYNETCEMPTREPRKGLDLPIAIYFGKSNLPQEVLSRRVHYPLFKADSDNDKCKVTVFVPVHMSYTAVNVDFSVSDAEIKVKSLGGLEINTSVYLEKEDFPPGALYDNRWFNRSHHDGIGLIPTALFKLDFHNINTKNPSMPIHVTFYGAGKKMFSTELWIDYIGCPQGKYGMTCEKLCICKNDADCSVFNGACKCKPGWYGPACDIPKPVVEILPKQLYVEYGTVAFLTCESHNVVLPEENNEWMNRISWSFNNEYLNHNPLNHIIKEGFSFDERTMGISVMTIKRGVSEKTTGQYECKVTDKYNHVYVASTTLATVCPTNVFGRYCNMSCDCVPGSSTSCDRYLGCMCKTGWTGRHCHIDLVSPKFDGCPQEITKVIRDEDTETNVTWQVPTVSDNSENVTVQNNYAPGSVFHIGTTKVKYTAIDSANNTDTCEFKVKVMICFYLGYRYRLQMYLLLTTDIDDFEDDGDKEYDAFVLYSSKDEDFAEDIMKRLERNGKYKLLLHHRDFIAGKAIFDNIEDSFDNSRTAILVISPNFLESGTCEHEARIALDNWINRRQKLIPVVKGGIEQANHSQVIKRIVKFITYIKWPENGSEEEVKTFWIELENALDKNMKKTRIGLFKRALAALLRCRGKGYTSVPAHVI